MLRFVWANVLCFVLGTSAHLLPTGPDNAIMASEDSLGQIVNSTIAQIQTGATPVKIYIYTLPAKFNQDLVGLPHTNLEMVEFEMEMESLIRRSRYFTNQIQDATHYFIPVYGVTYCAVQKARDSSFGCKRTRQFLVEAISHVKQQNPEIWTRNKGADHLIASGYDFGACYATFAKDANKWKRPLELEQARVIGFLGVVDTPKSNPGRCYNNRDIVLPPYVSKLMRNQLTRQSTDIKTTSVFLRTGSADRNPIRGKLIQAFKNHPRAIMSTDLVSEEEFALEMRTSRFCLSPPGFAPWSFRLSEAVLAECIPVLPNANKLVLPCNRHIDYSTLAILADGDDVNKIKASITQVETNPEFLSQAEMSLKLARRFFEYGDATMDCLASQL